MTPLQSTAATAEWGPGGVPSILANGRFLVRGKGGTCWDQEGKPYIDFVCGYCPIILGHEHPDVTAAVADQMSQGTVFPTRHPLHEALAAEIGALLPNAASCLFLKTGSEAVSAAVRIARAATGRQRVVRCGFHGWHDQMVSPYRAWHRYHPDPRPTRQIPGIPRVGPDPLVVAWDGQDLAQLRMLCSDPHPAALILDPVQVTEPSAESFAAIRQVTSSEGMLLILDEIKTGFRVHLGGVQGLYGVEADLTLLSKAISNGLPLAVVAGHPSLIGLPRGAKVMGTYNGELVAIAAALATLRILRRGGSVDRLGHVGTRLLAGLNIIVRDMGLEEQMIAAPYRWPCMPFVGFCDDPRGRQLSSRFFAETAERGVLLLENHMSYTCLAHTDADVDAALSIIEDVLRRLVRDGL